MKVCPVVKDDMDEDIIDDKEEQSEESRAVRVGQKKTATPTLAEREEHRHCVAARPSNPAHRGRKFTRAVEDDKDMKQVSYDDCFVRDPSGLESATLPVSKDRSYPHGVSSCGAVERSSSWPDGSTLCSRFGTIGTLSGNLDV